jgi:phosphoserine phosphatase RsbU/P
MENLSLTDLLDEQVLQKIQDSFAAATRLHVVTRNAAGQPVTRHSHPTPLCDLIDGATLRAVFGDPLDIAAARAWRPTDERPIGVVSFTDPIELDGRCVGSIEMLALLGLGDPPPAILTTLGLALALDVEHVRRLVSESTAVSPEEVDAAHALLRSIAGVLSDLCRRNAESRRQVRELATLRDVSRLLTGASGLQERLDLLTRLTTEALGVKGCLIRLLDDDGDELLVKSVYNLSRRYLEKGPVLLAESATDQEVLGGGVVTIADVTQDPRSIYAREAAEEGLCSMLCTGLRSRGRPLGTIRAYTSRPHQFTDDETRLFEAIANQASSTIESALLRERSRRVEALDHELAAAAEIQRHLLPARAPDLPGFQIASRYIPFSTVGGDFYDFVPIENQHLGIAIADVAGKGIPGAILMAATRAILRGHIDTVYAARDIVAHANRSLCRDIAEDQFVTLFYGALDTVTRRLTYCNAGHVAPILFRDGQSCELIEGGLVLGIDPDAPYEERQFLLHPGDLLVLYTDGLTDTMNPEGETFNRPRLLETIRLHLHVPAADLVDAIWTAVRAFARGAPARDDFTIIVLRVV